MAVCLLPTSRPVCYINTLIRLIMSGHFQKHLKLAIYNICTQIQKPDIVTYSILYFTMGGRWGA